MQKQRFSIDIQASRERVWKTLWEDSTLRDWASVIDEGTYMVGELKEGSEVQFISSSSGYGVTSLVEEIIPNEMVKFKQMIDTLDFGERERDAEWTGGTEQYSLTTHNDLTTLSVEIDIPPEQEETFKIRFPKALERVKFLAEDEG